MKAKKRRLALFYYRFVGLGGADGELAAATRYLNQRYSMPHGEIIGILTDIGTEEAEMALSSCWFPEGR